MSTHLSEPLGIMGKLPLGFHSSTHLSQLLGTMGKLPLGFCSSTHLSQPLGIMGKLSLGFPSSIAPYLQHIPTCHPGNPALRFPCSAL